MNDVRSTPENSEPTSATDEELDAASGGKASSGDTVIIAGDENDQGVIA